MIIRDEQPLENIQVCRCCVAVNILAIHSFSKETLPLKNLFNTQYARDISQKVKSSLYAKQQRGEFVGAFASYGYCKDPQNHNRLVIDPPAAEVVRRIFTLFENGMGKIRIAKQLNEEGIPLPQRVQAAHRREIPQQPPAGGHYLLDICHHPSYFAKRDVHREYGAGEGRPPSDARQGKAEGSLPVDGGVRYS